MIKHDFYDHLDTLHRLRAPDAEFAYTEAPPMR